MPGDHSRSVLLYCSGRSMYSEYDIISALLLCVYILMPCCLAISFVVCVGPLLDAAAVSRRSSRRVPHGRRRRDELRGPPTETDAPDAAGTDDAETRNGAALVAGSDVPPPTSSPAPRSHAAPGGAAS